MTDDHTAAREALREQAFAYVERLEGQVSQLRGDLAKEVEAHADTISELESIRKEFLSLRDAIHMSQGNFEGGLLQALQDEAERSLKLKRAVEAAEVNLRGDGLSGALPSSSLNAARRNLKEGLSEWQAGGASRRLNVNGDPV